VKSHYVPTRPKYFNVKLTTIFKYWTLVDDLSGYKAGKSGDGSGARWRIERRKVENKVENRVEKVEN
jgi:hypothetical protein